jgi:uncharacterized protein
MNRAPLNNRPACIGAGIIATAACLTLAACSSAPLQDFTLSAPNQPTPRPDLTAPQRFIDLAPIAMPETLMRPQWLVRDADGATVHILPQYRWTSSFDKEWHDAMSEQLSKQLSALDVHGAAPPGVPVWRVSMALPHFEMQLGREVAATASWTIRRTDMVAPTSCIWRGTVPVGPGALAAALGVQAVLGAVSASVAQNVLSLEKGEAPRCAASEPPAR